MELKLIQLSLNGLNNITVQEYMVLNGLDEKSC